MKGCKMLKELKKCQKNYKEVWNKKCLTNWVKNIWMI